MKRFFSVLYAFFSLALLIFAGRCLFISADQGDLGGASAAVAAPFISAIFVGIYIFIRAIEKTIIPFIEKKQDTAIPATIQSAKPEPPPATRPTGMYKIACPKCNSIYETGFVNGKMNPEKLPCGKCRYEITASNCNFVD